eukprot:2991523-Rhodomonas_salina.5
MWRCTAAQDLSKGRTIPSTKAAVETLPCPSRIQSRMCKNLSEIANQNADLLCECWVGASFHCPSAAFRRCGSCSKDCGIRKIHFRSANSLSCVSKSASLDSQLTFSPSTQARGHLRVTLAWRPLSLFQFLKSVCTVTVQEYVSITSNLFCANTVT